jgi:hypothetical protein
LLRRSKYRLSSREGRHVCQVAILERSVRRGMPTAICTTHVAAYRLGCGGGESGASMFWESRCSGLYPKGGHASSGALVPIGVRSSLHKGPGGRPKTGHLADALTLDTPYSSVRGRGQIPFPIGFAPGLSHYWPRYFPIASGAAFTLSRSYTAGARQEFALG